MREITQASRELERREGAVLRKQDFATMNIHETRCQRCRSFATHSFFFFLFFYPGFTCSRVRKVGIECTLRNKAVHKSLFSAQVMHAGLGSNVKLDVDITRIHIFLQRILRFNNSNTFYIFPLIRSKLTLSRIGA